MHTQSAKDEVAINAGSKFSLTLFVGLFSLLDLCCESGFCEGSSPSFSMDIKAGDDVSLFLEPPFLDLGFGGVGLSDVDFLCTLTTFHVRTCFPKQLQHQPQTIRINTLVESNNTPFTSAYCLVYTMNTIVMMMWQKYYLLFT